MLAYLHPPLLIGPKLFGNPLTILPASALRLQLSLPDHQDHGIVRPQEEEHWRKKTLEEEEHWRNARPSNSNIWQ